MDQSVFVTPRMCRISDTVLPSAVAIEFSIRWVIEVSVNVGLPPATYMKKTMNRMNTINPAIMVVRMICFCFILFQANVTGQARPTRGETSLCSERRPSHCANLWAVVCTRLFDDFLFRKCQKGPENGHFMALKAVLTAFFHKIAIAEAPSCPLGAFFRYFLRRGHVP